LLVGKVKGPLIPHETKVITDKQIKIRQTLFIFTLYCTNAKEF